MKKEQKLVALCAVLPVLADFIEDLNDNGVFRQGLKNKATMLMKEIEKVDENTEKEQFYQNTFTMKVSNLCLEETRKMYEKLWNSGESIVVYLDKDGNLKQFKNKNK